MFKKLAATLMGVVMVAGVALAGDNHSTDYRPDYAPVNYTDDVFVNASRNGGQINVNYGANFILTNEEFKYWKLMGAYDMNVPVYPDKGAIKVGMSMGDTSHTDWKDGNKYYRICLITKRYTSHPDYNQGKYGRYCSNVLHVPANTDGSVSTDNGSTNTTTSTTTTSTKPVSQVLKDKIDDGVEGMVERLRNDHSDEDVVVLLERVARKLNEIGRDRPEIAHIAEYVRVKVQEHADLLKLGDLMDLIN